MAYINIPDNYFNIPVIERIQLAKKAVYNKGFDIQSIIKETSVELIVTILNKRLDEHIKEEEYEQADFLNKVINIIEQNFNEYEKGV